MEMLNLGMKPGKFSSRQAHREMTATGTIQPTIVPAIDPPRNALIMFCMVEWSDY